MIGMAGRLKITLIITLLILAVLTVLTVLPKQAAAQSDSCTEAIGNCNYEFTTNGVTPSFVGAQAVITNTMTVQSYSGETVLAFLYNPDWGLACYSPSNWLSYWIQGIIAYGVVENPPGQPGTIGDLYLMVQIYKNCQANELVWSNLPPDLSQPTASFVPWPLVSGSKWEIIYYVGSNGKISQVYEYLYIPTNGGEYYQQYIPIPSQYTNYWYRSNVNWGGSPGGGSVTFYPGGSGQIFYNSNVNLYQGPLAANAAENSTAMYTQMYLHHQTHALYTNYTKTSRHSAAVSP